jgi:hypothetical protein
MPSKLLICTDIYGQTHQLETWVEKVLPSGWQKQIVSPYRQGTAYYIESVAYQGFQHQGGLDGYANRIASACVNQPVACVAIGFSAGAAGMYKVLSEEVAHSVVSFIGFYPGQIRFFTDLQPSVPTRLIFPCREANFKVDTVMHRLDRHVAVNCELSSYQHGFMNPLSRGFSESGLNQFTAQITELLSTF